MVPVPKRLRISNMQTPQSFSSQVLTSESTPASQSRCATVSPTADDDKLQFETPECVTVVPFAPVCSVSADVHLTLPSVTSAGLPNTTTIFHNDPRGIQRQPFASDSMQHSVFDQLCTVPAVYRSSRKGAETLNRGMRWQLIAWMGEVCRSFKLAEFTFSLSVNYIDRILVRDDIFPDEIQPLAGCCILLAAKIYEVCPPALDGIAYVCEQESAACMVGVEKQVLNMLDFHLSVQTPHGIVDWLAHKALQGSAADRHTIRVVRYARFALSAGLHDLYVARCPPGSVTVAAVFVALAVAHLPNKCLAQWTHLPHVAPAVAHTILACRSVVSRVKENASFLSVWHDEATAFDNASLEIASLLNNPLPTFLEGDSDSHQPLPFPKRKSILHKRSAVRAPQCCHSVKAPDYANASCHEPLVVGRKRAKAVDW